MLLLTLRGTPTHYYGDELGLENVAIPPQAVHDPWEKQEPGLGLGRDPVRTPMPWDDTPYAGFTGGAPWLPLNPDWRTRNVAAELDDARSILTLYRRLLALRRSSDALRIGDYGVISGDSGVLGFERRAGTERMLVVLNLTGEPRRWRLPEGAKGQAVMSTVRPDADETVQGELVLLADEGVIVRLS